MSVGLRVMKRLSGLCEIVDGVDVFLLDQFGVLHDGADLYPETIATLEALKRLGKPVVILSNSGKRAASNITRMERMGLRRDLYHQMVTSGEVAWKLLQDDGADGRERGYGRCYLITSGEDQSAVADLDIELQGDPAAADFILLAGSEGNIYPEAHYRDLLAPAAARRVACICTNPDKISLLGKTHYFGPGRIAEIYQELGGQVRWIGKPHPEIYEYATALHPGVDRSRILCVGDSIEHDIAGATAAGLKSVLVRGGIFADAPDDEIARVAGLHQVCPDFQIPMFRF